ncbi:uncharacterized protein LOC120354279 [Nilaparvata lugens]|uniref:uncharacterized protein LOC120354279 n=1 Tax=Nilaparvata lugens TaxID=108931 RepID=UPI00193E9B8B|nr:uncharacterized protein LOC120354279 [Nilaparvata lugens]
MYNDIKTRVLSPAGVGPEFEVKIGVHQGSTLSPLLFNIVMNYITAHLQKPAPWLLLYADDIVLVAETLQQVQIDLTAWCTVLESRGLRVSCTKTEYMHCNFSGIGISNISMAQPQLDGTPLKQVDHFKYLVSTLACTASVDRNIKDRITAAWLKWRSLTGVICDAKMPIDWRRPGRLPTTWMGTISKDMRMTDSEPELTQQCSEWRKRIRRADPKRNGT